MIRLGCILLLQFGIFNASAQGEQFIVFDATSDQYIVSQISAEQLVFTKPYLIKNWEFPPQEIFCQQNNSHFSGMLAIGNFINNEQFPASATVKIVSFRGDTALDRCSGMLVGNKYVLTAAHCVLKDADAWLDIKVFVPDLYVKPGFDRGQDSKFGKIKVLKTYLYKSYFQGKSKKDIALLELEDSVGEKTGWVGLGFEEEKQKILNTRFVNFSYPMDASRMNYSQGYNGDTMYLKVGFPDLVSNDYIGINSLGIPGESGSLLISENNDGFTAFGVRNFSEEKFSFYRLKEEDVKAFYSLIYRNKNNAEAKTVNLSHSNNNWIGIQPNPVSDRAIISTNSSADKILVVFYDLCGKEVIRESLFGTSGKFIFENNRLTEGTYYFTVSENNVFFGGAKMAISK